VAEKPQKYFEGDIMKDLRSNLNAYYFINQSYWFFSFGYFTCHQL